MTRRRRIIFLASTLIVLTVVNSWLHATSIAWAGAFSGVMVGIVVNLLFHLTRPVLRTFIATTVPASEPAWVVIRTGSGPAVAWIAVPVPEIEGRDRDLSVFVSPKGPVAESVTIGNNPSPSSPQWN